MIASDTRSPWKCLDKFQTWQKKVWSLELTCQRAARSRDWVMEMCGYNLSKPSSSDVFFSSRIAFPKCPQMIPPTEDWFLWCQAYLFGSCSMMQFVMWKIFAFGCLNTHITGMNAYMRKTWVQICLMSCSFLVLWFQCVFM